MAKVTLFEDVCVVLEVDPDGKRFDKGPLARRCVRQLSDVRAASVSRIRCRGDHSDAEVTVDVNVDIYPVKARRNSLLCPRADKRQANEKYAFALSSTLAEDGTPDDGAFDQARTLAAHSQSAPHQARRGETGRRCLTSSST